MSTDLSVLANVSGDGTPSRPESSHNDILAQLSPASLALVMEHAEEIALSTREDLFKQGDPVDAVYFPLTGMMSLLVALKNGSMIEALTVGREGFVGTPLLNEVKTARYRGVCQIQGKFLAIKTEAFVAALRQAPDLQRKLRRYSQYATDVVSQSAACNSIHTIEQRCARWLLVTSDAIRNLEFSLTQEFLSQMLAVRRPGVNVAMRALTRRELVSHRYGKVTILDVAGLKDAACECYGTTRERAAELLGN
jgi:CRP-like cAMP-binding protein